MVACFIFHLDETTPTLHRVPFVEIHIQLCCPARNQGQCTRRSSCPSILVRHRFHSGSPGEGSKRRLASQISGPPIGNHVSPPACVGRDIARFCNLGTGARRQAWLLSEPISRLVRQSPACEDPIPRILRTPSLRCPANRNFVLGGRSKSACKE